MFIVERGKSQGQFAETRECVVDMQAGAQLKKIGVKRLKLLPVVNYNVYDGIALGGIVTNALDTLRGLQYLFMPQYAFASKRIVGDLGLYYFGELRRKAWDHVALRLNAKSYSFFESEVYQTKDIFYKLAPEIALFKTKRTEDACVPKRFSYRFIFIAQRFTEAISVDEYRRDFNSYYVNELRYEQRKESSYNPHHLILFAHQGNGFLKIFGHRKQFYKIKEKKYFSWYVNFSWLPYNRTTIDDAFVQLSPNGTTGLARFQGDYTLDQSMFGRSERTGIWSQQIFDQGAGLQTVAGAFDIVQDWIVGFGTSVDLPFKLPIRPYAGLAVYPSGITTKLRSVLSAGIELEILPSYFSLYLPIYESQVIREHYRFNGRDGYLKRIAFKLNLSHPSRLVDRYHN